MSIVMNMSGYEIEREDASVGEYGDEVMCAEWNPQLALACEQPVTTGSRGKAMPDGLANVDVEAFLKKMYQYQC